jgi:hypothetical protein
VTGTGNVTGTGTGTGIGTGVPDAGGPGIGDAGSGGRKDSSAGDGGTDATGIKLGHSGCGCDLGSAPARGFGIESVLGLLGAILVWRRTRKRR